MNTITDKLFTLKDDAYKSFYSKLMPTVCPDRIIGVRTPVLRKYANELFKSGRHTTFMSELPHSYYEENNLHAFIIEKIADYRECIHELNRFLPHVDNWATCDMMTPEIFGRYRMELLKQIDMWLKSSHPYIIRYAIRMLMTFFLDENFRIEYVDRVAHVRNDEYYVKMMVAWYFATALAKQYDAVVPYIENHLLPAWIHNKTIQKAVESYRISDEKKIYLRTLKRKQKMEESKNE